MAWLREQRVPIIELDCSGTPEEVWEQLLAVGRLMRPAVALPAPSGYGTARGVGGTILHVPRVPRACG